MRADTEWLVNTKEEHDPYRSTENEDVLAPIYRPGSRSSRRFGVGKILAGVRKSGTCTHTKSTYAKRARCDCDRKKGKTRVTMTSLRRSIVSFILDNNKDNADTAGRGYVAAIRERSNKASSLSFPPHLPSAVENRDITL